MKVSISTSRSSSLAVTSSGLSSDVSDVGLPSEKVMVSGKNGDDGDLLLFRDGLGACDISAGTLRLASQVFLEWSVLWRLPIPGSCQSEEGVGTFTGRVILFGTIPTTIPDTTLSVIPPTTHIDTTPIPTVSHTIPPSPDYTPASPDYSPASDTEFNPSKDPSSDHIPPLPATLPFLSSANESSNSDIPDTPPSPTHGTLFNETTLSTHRSPVASDALRRRVMVLAPGQPIPHGMDIARITRKEPKTGQKRTRDEMSTQEPGVYQV
ncbi:hypothetical protein Tco_1100492 [Tanacetum coccineum]